MIICLQDVIWWPYIEVPLQTMFHCIPFERLNILQNDATENFFLDDAVWDNVSPVRIEYMILILT